MSDDISIEERLRRLQGLPAEPDINELDKRLQNLTGAEPLQRDLEMEEVLDMLGEDDMDDEELLRQLTGKYREPTKRESVEERLNLDDDDAVEALLRATKERIERGDKEDSDESSNEDSTASSCSDGDANEIVKAALDALALEEKYAQ